MTSRNTILVNNEMKGRWAGWLVWCEYVNSGAGNPACTHCNLAGSSIMFAVDHVDAARVTMIPTPDTISTLTAYSRSVCAEMDTSSSRVVGTSTKLKIQPSLNRGRATSLTLYGNGSVQFCGSPSDITTLYTCLFRIVRRAMDMEMIPFLETMRTVGLDMS